MRSTSKKISAGLLMYRFQQKTLEVFLAHPGGPFYAKKDAGTWGIPKGEIDGNDDVFSTAKREFTEETGIKIKPDTKFLDLGSIFQPSGKQVYAWAFEDGTFDPKVLTSNLTPFGWPEIDRGDYFSIPKAREKIFKPQEPFLDRLVSVLR